MYDKKIITRCLGEDFAKASSSDEIRPSSERQVYVYLLDMFKYYVAHSWGGGTAKNLWDVKMIDGHPVGPLPFHGDAQMYDLCFFSEKNKAEAQKYFGVSMQDNFCLQYCDDESDADYALTFILDDDDRLRCFDGGSEIELDRCHGRSVEQTVANIITFLSNKEVTLAHHSLFAQVKAAHKVERSPKVS